MASFVLARLTNRKLLKISGPDCYPYLQGLISNDLRYLYEPDRIPQSKYASLSPNVLSAFMLNAQGRAICDLLIYRTPTTRLECSFSPPGILTEPDDLLIECDAKLASGLANTLYGYRVRRKISISLKDKLSVWCLFPKFDLDRPGLTLTYGKEPLYDIMTQQFVTNQLTVVNDPRLRSMGMRIISISRDFNDVKYSIQSFINTDIQEGSIKDYLLNKYLLGVGEGLGDHPESNCLPLECNADFLNSVSFSKGCYLGQELTARIHHTGVVRKRLMPIILDLATQTKDSGPLIANTDIIEQISRKKIGSLRSVVKNRGLALLRHDSITETLNLIHEGSSTKISTYKPYWWNSPEK